MARTDTLGNFLTDVADAIREKKGTSEAIQASNFDTEIQSISSGGDASEYFNTEPENITDVIGWVANNYVKKIPTLTIPNNVTSLQYLFKDYGLDKTPKVICGNQVTNMRYMYNPLGTSNSNDQNYTSSIKDIDLSGLDTSKVWYMDYMFAFLTNITDLDLNNIDTSSLYSVNGMFRGCKSLTNLDLSNFHIIIHYGGNAKSMFSDCSSLTNIKLNDSFMKFENMSTQGSYLEYMFQNCSKLESIDLSGIDTETWLNSLKSMFSGCSSLKTVIFGNKFNTSNVKNMQNSFYNCTSLTKIDARNLDFAQVTSYSFTFNGVPSDCLIIVKDQANKDWFASKFSNLTNVQTLEEYNQSQGE